MKWVLTHFKMTRLEKRSLVVGLLAVMLVATVAFSGCTIWHALDTASSIHYQNKIQILGALEDPDVPEESKAWLRSTVNPWMNIVDHTFIAHKAWMEGDVAKLGNSIDRMLFIGLRLEYDPTRLIGAIKTGDLDMIEAETRILAKRIRSWLKVKGVWQMAKDKV